MATAGSGACFPSRWTLRSATNQQDQPETRRLQLDLRRKDKALAEAVAMLNASKKIQA